MDSPPHAMSSTPKALNPVSPRRMNQRNVPSSPSLPSDLLNLQQKHSHGVSDVQSRVAFLNNMAREGNQSALSPSSSGHHAAALQRAILGREEAESALDNVSTQLSETQSRERRISERVESLLEELQTAKERQAHERTVFEKEIKKARKEAFRAGSTLVKAQEQLKHSRTEIKALKDEVLAEREAKEKAKQDAFERAYTLAGLTEELEVLKGRLRSVEATNHSHTLEVQAQQMRKEDIGRTSLDEGDLDFLITPRRPKRSVDESANSPTPASANQIESSETPPKRQRVSEVATQEETRDVAMDDSQTDTIEELEDELWHEKRLRVKYEDLINYMKMECQFKRCSCRIAEMHGYEYVHDREYHEMVKKRKQMEQMNGDGAEGNRGQNGKKRTIAETGHETAHPSTEDTAEDAQQVGEEPHNPSADAPHEIQHVFNEARSPSPSHGPASDESVGRPQQAEAASQDSHEGHEEENLIAFSPVTGTFKTVPSPRKDDARDQYEPLVIESIDSQIDHHEPPHHSPLIDTSERGRDRHPVHPGVVAMQMKASSTTRETHTPDEDIPPNTKSHTTTKRVPLRNNDPSPNQPGIVPGTPVNREQALAQIRARRGRARSENRSASASDARPQPRSAKTAETPIRGARRIPGFNKRPESRAEGGKRDMSVPTRAFRR